MQVDENTCAESKAKSRASAPLIWCARDCHLHKLSFK